VKQTPIKKWEGTVMEDNKNLVTEVTENVEQTTEETTVEIPEKTYTQSEVNEMMGKRLARNSAKIRKEFERKYGELEDVLKAGTGKESVEEITDTFTKFYQSKGIRLREQPKYSAKDIEVLANAEAAEVINSGYEEVADEVDRLAKIGVDNMTPREVAYFKVLAEHRNKAERENELAKIGVTEDVYNSDEFKKFAGMFNATTPIAEIYNIYNKQKPKKEIKPMGSMTNKTSEDGTVKDFYTRDEALQFTKEDFDKNPSLYKAVQESMLKW
jgi:hypothetical protein